MMNYVLPDQLSKMEPAFYVGRIDHEGFAVFSKHSSKEDGLREVVRQIRSVLEPAEIHLLVVLRDGEVVKLTPAWTYVSPDWEMPVFTT